MNTRPTLEPVKQPFALAAAFNADNSCFAVAHESGFRGELFAVMTRRVLTKPVFKSASCEMKISRGTLFDSTTTYAFSQHTDLSGGIGCADMVGTSNYIILAGGGKAPYFPANKVGGCIHCYGYTYM